MANRFITQNGNILKIGERIAKGGEGEVFEIINIPNALFKSYYKDMRTEERMKKLDYMCSNAPKNISNNKFLICWPTEIVYDNGEFAGFIMPKAFHASVSTYNLCQTELPQSFTSYWKSTYDRTSFQGRINRLMLSTNIAAAIQRIHATGTYVIADLKPQNLLITSDGKVSVIDMDSVQIANNEYVIFKAPVSTPEYTPPEAKEILKSGKPISVNWDIFSLGIIIYEILCGIHPYAGTARHPYEELSTIAEKIEKNLTYIITGKSLFKVLPPPHENYTQFSIQLQNMFKSIFLYSKSSSRPSTMVIGETLAQEVNFVNSQKDKIETANAIKKYEQSKLEINRLQNNLNKLNEEIIGYKETINKKNDRISAFVLSLIILSILFITSTIIIIDNSDHVMGDENNLTIKGYQAKIDQQKKEINNLWVERADLQTTVSKLKAENSELYSDISTLKIENNGLESNLVELNNEVQKLNQEVQTTKNAINNKVQQSNFLPSKHIKEDGTFIWSLPQIQMAENIGTCNRYDEVRVISKFKDDVAYVEVNNIRGFIYKASERIVGYN